MTEAEQRAPRAASSPHGVSSRALWPCVCTTCMGTEGRGTSASYLGGDACVFETCFEQVLLGVFVRYLAV
eukprot:3947920-Prymnesium_polylepis.2